MSMGSNYVPNMDELLDEAKEEGMSEEELDELQEKLEAEEVRWPKHIAIGSAICV